MSIKKELYAKFPNNFFYKEAKVFIEIGGQDSFLIYSLFTSRKNMLNKIHITLKDMMDTLELDSNRNRSKKRIMNSLNLLMKFNYIISDRDIVGIRSTDTIVFDWVDRFPDKKVGWIPFYADDFELYHKIGSTAYTLMWLLRMLRNHKTNNSFPSIELISSTLKISNSTIKSILKLFDEGGLFEIKRGDYYYNTELEQYMKYHNTYKYTGEKGSILKMSDSTIDTFFER